MIKEYTISNFKAFSEPATLPIKPITLIYGPNSAGKSSILQSLLLLKQSNYPLDYKTMKKQLESNECGGTDPLNINGAIKDFVSYERIIHNNQLGNKFSAQIMFDANVFDKHYLKFKMPSKTKHLINAFSNNYDRVGLQHTYQYNSGMQEVKSHKLSMFIGNKSFFDVIDDQIDINQNHKFWPIYWNKFGKNIALSDFRALLEYIKKKQEMSDGYPQIGYTPMSDEEINNLFQMESRLAKCEEGIDSELISFFENFYSKSCFFPSYVSAFHAREIELADYSLGDCLDISNDQYHQLEVIFSGLTYNKQKDYFSDNMILIGMILSELIADFFDKIVYIGPVRSLPEKFEFIDGEVVEDQYVGKDGSRIGKILIDNRHLLQEINEALFRLGTEYHIEFIHSQRIETNKHLFNLNIRRNFSNISSSITEVGYGISQIIPIIVQSVISKDNNILIEQPELHLHPALQAELGDLFIDSALKKNNTLLVETHSEHVLLRIMRRIRETTNGDLPEGATPVSPEDVSVVYVESIETDGDRHSIIREMPLNDQGELVMAWPGGFFEEGLREVF